MRASPGKEDLVVPSLLSGRGKGVYVPINGQIETPRHRPSKGVFDNVTKSSKNIVEELVKPSTSKRPQTRDCQDPEIIPSDMLGSVAQVSSPRSKATLVERHNDEVRVRFPPVPVECHVDDPWQDYNVPNTRGGRKTLWVSKNKTASKEWRSNTSGS